MAQALGSLRKVRWSDSVLQLIARTLRPAPGFDSGRIIRNSVKSGEMELWQVNDHSAAVTQFTGDTLRVHCYEGKDVLGFAGMFHHIAKQNGCKRITFHADNPALVKKLKPYQPRSLGDNEYEVSL